MELVKRVPVIGQGYWPAFGVFALGVCLLSTLLYVVAFLRSGLAEAFQQAETQKLRSHVVELTEKVSAYEGQLRMTLEGGAREIEKRSYEALLARTELVREVAVHAEHLDGALPQVVRFFDVEREDLVRDVPLRNEQAHDGERPELTQGRQPMIAVGRPVGAFFPHDDDGVEKSLRLVHRPR